MASLGSYLSSRHNEKIMLIRLLFSAAVFFSIILNSFIPRFFAGSFDNNLFSRFFQSQTIVFEYFNFTSVPIDIVNHLFANNSGSAVSDKNKTPKKEKNSSSVSEFNFISCQTAASLSANLSQNLVNIYSSLLIPMCSVSLAESSLDPPWGRMGVLLFSMFCFFLLPRSSINDAYIAIANRACHITRFEKSNRVFLLLNMPFPKKSAGNLPPFPAKDFIYFPDGRTEEFSAEGGPK